MTPDNITTIAYGIEKVMPMGGLKRVWGKLVF